MEKLLSLCMIVKNEEKFLQRCLESVQDLVDEIVIVDTGSTDKTKEIAAMYTNKIFDFTWVNDFSAARNESLKHATGEWILVLDADEYVQNEDKDKFKNYLLSQDSSKPVAFILPIMNFTGQSTYVSGGLMESDGVRLFPNSKDIYFTSPIHEQVTYKQGPLNYSTYPYVIFHSGYLREIVSEKEKSQRNMGIFNSTKGTGNSSDPYHCFTLANEFMSAGNYEKAAYYYERSFSRIKPNYKWYHHCLNRYIYTLIAKNRFKTALDLIDEALQKWNNYTDYHYLKGIILQHFGMYDDAIKAFETCIEIAEQSANSNKPFWLVFTTSGKLMPYQKLFEIYFGLLNRTKAVFYLIKVLNQDPRSLNHLYKLANLLSQTEPPADIVTVMEKLYPGNDKIDNLLLFNVFLKASNDSLALYYFQKCESLQIESKIDGSELVQFALLSKNKVLFDQSINKLNNANDSERTLYLASQIWPEGDYSILPSTKHDDEFWSTVLVELFNLKQFDSFDDLIHTVGNADIINRLANYLYSNYYFDLALDYYNILMQNDILQSSGYMNLGMLHFTQNISEEGLNYIRTSIELEPSLPAILFVCKHTQDESLKIQYKEKFIDLYPQHKNISFIQSL